MPTSVTRSQSPLKRLAYTAMEAPAVLGVSDDFFRKHIARDLRWIRLGSKKLVSERELDAWLERTATHTFGETQTERP